MSTTVEMTEAEQICEGILTNAVYHYNAALLVYITNFTEMPDETITARSRASKQNHTKPITFITGLLQGSQELTLRDKTQ